MTKPVIVLPQAEEELRLAAADYETRAAGLARSFIRELRAAFNRIERTPRLYACVDGDVRRALLHRFPFGVFYEEAEEVTRVLAVLDLRRQPGRLLAVVRSRIEPSEL